MPATAATTIQRVAFEMNGCAYRTDAETLHVLNSIIPAAKSTNDFSAVAAVMGLGLHTGRITQTA